MTVKTMTTILVVSTLVVVGLLSAFTVKSQRSWYLRMTFVLAFLSPLLLVSARGPFITLLIEAATVATGLSLWHRAKTVQDAYRLDGMRLNFIKRIHFSSKDMALSIALVGMILAVVGRAPTMNSYDWASVISVGIPSGVCVLLGGLATELYAKWYVRWPIAVMFSLLVGIPLHMFAYSHLPRSWDHVTGSVICPGVYLTIATWCAIGKIVGLNPFQSQSTVADFGQRITFISRGALVLLSSAICLAPLFAYWVLLTPLQLWTESSFTECI